MKGGEMLDKLKNMFSKKDQVPASVSKDKGNDAKERATKNKEPYIAVLDVQMKEDNPRNGFFELDWNEYFVRDLRLNGYSGATEEEIVDAWFKELCGNIAKEQGVASDSVPMGAGYVNVKPLGDNKSEVS